MFPCISSGSTLLLATIALLGAVHISIDAGAMFLVHKCLMAFFEWVSLNSDQLPTLIADCEKIKTALDKLDLNVASLYAKKRHKSVVYLLALMENRRLAHSKRSPRMGKIDEITDFADEPDPHLTDAFASAMANIGMSIPNIPISETECESAFGKFITVIASLFNSKLNTQMAKETTKPETQDNSGA